MPLYSPPRDFVEKLRHFDSALRIRWSDGQNRWRLERKISHGTVWPPSIWESPNQQEDRKAAADGYVAVGVLKQGELTDRVFAHLASQDIWRQGGAKAVADRMDENDILAERMARLRRSDTLEGLARERWRYMNTVRTVPESARHTGSDMSINLGV